MAYRYINPAWYGLQVYKSSLVWLTGYINPGLHVYKSSGMAYRYINPAWYGLQVYKSSLVWLTGI